MTIFVGGCKTLIVEQDDKLAERYENSLSSFPDHVGIRVKTDVEAIAMLKSDGEIQQVCLEGKVFTPEQAIGILGG